MPRPPRPNAIPRPTRRRNGEIITRRVEVGLTPADDRALAEHLGRRATAGDVRGLALLSLRLRAAILGIDAHATPVGLLDPSDPDGSPRYYAVTTGALHRALGLVGRTSPPCPACPAANKEKP